MKIGVVLCTLGERISLRDTFQSFEKIQDQIELIVICPLSTRERVIQESLAYIKPSNIEVVVQEKPGIYASMNQGATLIKSNFLIFINDDDMFDQDINKNFSNFISEVNKYDVLFASSKVVGQIKHVERPTTHYEKYVRIGRMPISHQAQIWSTETLKDCGLFQESLFLKFGHIVVRFNLHIASDFNTYVTAFLKGKKFGTSNLVLSSYSKGGMSDQRFQRRIIETILILYDKKIISLFGIFVLFFRFELSNLFKWIQRD
jgi:hypothetical protein